MCTIMNMTLDMKFDIRVNVLTTITVQLTNVFKVANF